MLDQRTIKNESHFIVSDVAVVAVVVVVVAVVVFVVVVVYDEVWFIVCVYSNEMLFVCIVSQLCLHQVECLQLRIPLRKSEHNAQ